MLNSQYIIALSITVSVFWQTHAQLNARYSVGLCIVATGKYISFVQPLVNSAKKYFCKNHDIYYFIFSDGLIPQDRTLIQLEQKRLGWPYDSLMRFAIYNTHRDNLSKMDYLFACDADMLFISPVGNEILSERVATLHPGFYDKERKFFSYENNILSTAYIPREQGIHYFAGGFYGGSKKEFLKMASIITDNIEKDLAKNYIAVWHDESHLNRYFIDMPPTAVLSPSYCYPEKQYLPYQKKLLALDKDHAAMRE